MDCCNNIIKLSSIDIISKLSFFLSSKNIVTRNAVEVQLLHLDLALHDE
jgi:hypothetical protein